MPPMLLGITEGHATQPVLGPKIAEVGFEIEIRFLAELEGVNSFSSIA